MRDEFGVIVKSPNDYDDTDSKATVFKFDYKDGIDTSKIVGILPLPTKNCSRDHDNAHSLMKGDTLFYVHDFDSLVMVDTQNLQLLHTIKTGITWKSFSLYGEGSFKYGIQCDKKTNSVCIWHEDKIKKFDESTLTILECYCR